MSTNGASYISPGIYKELIDMSGFSLQSDDNQIYSLQYIFSDRGIDNKVVTKNDYPELQKAYGTPNAAKYDDLGYNAAAKWAKGGLPAKVCRLTMPDAKKASAYLFIETVLGSATADRILYEKTKGYAAGDVVSLARFDSIGKFYFAEAPIAEYEENYFNQSGKWQQIFEYLPGAEYFLDDLMYLRDNDSKTIIMKANVDTTEDPTLAPATATDWDIINTVLDFDQIVKVTTKTTDTIVGNEVLFGKFEAVGTGSDYNGIYINCSLDAIGTQNAEGFPTYSWEVVDYSDEGVEARIYDEYGVITFAQYQDNVGDSLYVADIFGRYSKNVNFVPIKPSDADVSTLFTELKGRIVSLNETNFEKIFEAEVLSNLTAEKIIIAGGTDGSLFDTNGLINNDAKENLIKEFYMGITDESVLDYGSTAASFTFDMQQSVSVSIVANDFTKKLRDDIFIYHSGADNINEEADLYYIKRLFQVDNRCSSIRTQWVDVVDEFSGKILRVPMFLDKIKDLAASIKENGVARVHGGYNDEGQVKNFIPDSFNYKPSLQYRDRMYLARINPPVFEADGCYYLATRTLQKNNSKLSMEFVVQTDQRIMIETEVIARPFVDRFINDDFLGEVKSAFVDYFINRWGKEEAITSASVEVTSNDFDRKYNTVVVEMTITFANIAEKLILRRIIK